MFWFAQNTPSRTGALRHEIRPKYKEDRMAFFLQKQINNSGQDPHSAKSRVASRRSQMVTLCSALEWMPDYPLPAFQPYVAVIISGPPVVRTNWSLTPPRITRSSMFIHHCLVWIGDQNMGTDCSSQDIIGVRKWAENNIADPLCHEYNLSPQAVSTACMFSETSDARGNSFLLLSNLLEHWNGDLLSCNVNIYATIPWMSV